MQDRPWFKDWFNSPYYHQLYFKRNEAEAALFIDKLINHLQPAPNAKILDVACGKGRHSIYLSKKKFDVTGIDLSEESIAEALKSKTENLHFYKHDMRLPFWINYFDIAFNFFTSFGYFKTSKEHNNAIRTIAQSLKNNGSFILDYLNPHYAEAHQEKEFEKKIDGVNFVITKTMNKTHFYKKIVVEDPLLDQLLIYNEQVAKFTLEDFEIMFSKQGLHIKEVLGDYNLSTYDVIKSPRLIVIATKK
jgi:SAM-dependent methyltransferase